MMKEYCKNIISEIAICCLLLMSCTHEIPTDTHELLHGYWEIKGYSEQLALNYTDTAALDALNDSIDLLVIDPIYVPLGKESQVGCIANDISKSITHEDGSVTGWVGIDVIEDTITSTNDSCSNSIWVLEHCCFGDECKQYDTQLYYKGNGYFVENDSLDTGSRKFLRITNEKKLQAEYGVCDSHGKEIASRTIKRLFAGDKWKYRKSPDGLLENAYLDDSTESIYWDYIHQQPIKYIEQIDLYCSISADHDSLICSYSHTDITNKYGISFTGYDIDLDTIRNSFVDDEEVDLNDKSSWNKECDLIWSNDTAYLSQRRLQGDYYIVVTNNHKKSPKKRKNTDAL